MVLIFLEDEKSILDISTQFF